MKADYPHLMVYGDSGFSTLVRVAQDEGSTRRRGGRSRCCFSTLVRVAQDEGLAPSADAIARARFSTLVRVAQDEGCRELATGRDAYQFQYPRSGRSG